MKMKKQVKTKKKKVLSKNLPQKMTSKNTFNNKKNS